MSRPVSSGESLEAILASIRRSLAEQATDALDEEAVAAPEMLSDLEVPPVPESVLHQLAGGAPYASRSEAAGPGEPAADDDEPLPAMFARPSPAPAPAPAPAPGAEPSPGTGPAALAQKAPQKDPQNDPLWFLSHETAPKAATSAVAPGAPQKAVAESPAEVPPVVAAKPARAPEPKPSRPVVRGPLPPFFGSSVETVKVEIAPDPPVLSEVGMVPPTPPPQPAHTANGDARRNGGLENGQGAARPADALLNGKASAIFGPAPADARAGGADASAQMPALEVMVAELLRPMLRRWLDENMPRLVSAALKAEAALMSDRDPKKS